MSAPKIGIPALALLGLVPLMPACAITDNDVADGAIYGAVAGAALEEDERLRGAAYGAVVGGVIGKVVETQRDEGDEDDP